MEAKSEHQHKKQGRKRGRTVPPLLRELRSRMENSGGLLVEVSRKQVICDDSLLLFTAALRPTEESTSPTTTKMTTSPDHPQPASRQHKQPSSLINQSQRTHTKSGAEKQAPVKGQGEQVTRFQQNRQQKLRLNVPLVKGRQNFSCGKEELLVLRRCNKRQVLNKLAAEVAYERQRQAQLEKKQLQQRELNEKQRIAALENSMKEQLERERGEIKKKLKRAFEENLKIKVEHQKQKRLAARQSVQMDEIKQQLEQVQQENMRLSLSLSKLETSFCGQPSSNKSSFCQSQAVVQPKVVQLTILNEDSSNADDQIKQMDIEPLDTPNESLVSEESMDQSQIFHLPLAPVQEDSPLTSREQINTKTFTYEHALKVEQKSSLMSMPMQVLSHARQSHYRRLSQGGMTARSTTSKASTTSSFKFFIF